MVDTYLFVPESQIVQARMDQVDDVARVGALSDDGEEDDGERSGDEGDGWKAAAAGGSRRLEVEGCV